MTDFLGQSPLKNAAHSPVVTQHLQSTLICERLFPPGVPNFWDTGPFWSNSCQHPPFHGRHFGTQRCVVHGTLRWGEYHPPNHSLALTHRKGWGMWHIYIFICKTMMCKEYTHRNLNKIVIGMKTLNYTVQSAKYLRGPTVSQTPQERYKPRPFF